MLKEEPDKLCTQLDILASLASSELQSHGLLNGIKVRNKNGTIEADLLLPRMPIQTIKESTSSTRLRSDHSTAQPIMTTDGLFNSSYYLDLSTNNSKLQTTSWEQSRVHDCFYPHRRRSHWSADASDTDST